MQLGFFSFAKLLMFHDLNPANWPDGSLERHNLTRGLLYESFEPESPLFAPEDRLDEKLKPHDLYHVIDADASQAKVIEEVRCARNLVVQGPPGTGKSQTISNIIAAAVKDGKRVLFVAEKMAALSVVHKRLLDVGLQDVCLELHSKSANKRAVHAELARTLNAARATPDMPQPPDALLSVRNRLNAIAGALHRPLGTSGETPFTALAEQVSFIGRGAPAPMTHIEDLDELSREDTDRIGDALKSYGAIIGQAGARAAHPFAGIRKLDLQPTDLDRAANNLLRAGSDARVLAAIILECGGALGVEVAQNVDQVEALSDQLGRLSGLPDADGHLLTRLIGLGDKARLRETLAIGSDWRRLNEETRSTLIEGASQRDVSDLRSALVAGETSLFARWGGAYRRASRELAGLLVVPLPKRAHERVEHLDTLLRLRNLEKQWREDEHWAAGAVGDPWRGERTDFEGLLSALDWASRVSVGSCCEHPEKLIALATDANTLDRLCHELTDNRAKLANALDSCVLTFDMDSQAAFDAGRLEEAELGCIASRVQRMASAMSRYEEWATLERLRGDLAREGLSALAQSIESGSFGAEDAVTEFRFARAEAIWKEAINADPLLADLRQLNRNELVETFAALEKQRLKDAVTIIRSEHLKQVPQGARGSMAVIRGELARRSRHMPLRKLFTGAGEAIQRIKPVLLMSPISVAQFLPPGLVTFDLLVIDEASQVRPEDALGAVARAEQIVVVGDQKQLPPTSFFDRLGANSTGDDDEEDEEHQSATQLLDGATRAAELESILTLCEARGLPPRMLEWHYRSRDPSLIRVSNKEFYRDELILPPSPLQNDPSFGLCFTHVAGAYDRGGKRDNKIEGRAVVQRIKEHAAQMPSLSLGVVTFSSAQKNAITELLEYERRQDATLDEFLREGATEEVFVKNIENVQGDERDVILVSVGYGPTEGGGRLMNMNFGPINGEGGERRLNVLFTRARLRCEVFASFDPGDIDLSKVTKAGPRVLKRFLEFAKTGRLDDAQPSGASADTPFESDVVDVIRSLGYPVDHQVGSAGFLIDLGVRHPGRPGSYILAVECDGATYHSALWARERDRLRQSVLEHLGWKFHRVWSTDWFYRRSAEIDRLKDSLERAAKAAEAGIVIDGANAFAPPQQEATVTAEPIVAEPATERQMPSYRRSTVSVRSYVEPHEADLRLLARLVAQIVGDEGPIHEEEVARRLAAAFGRERAGSRILAATKKALQNARTDDGSSLYDDAKFWFTREQRDAPPVRSRAAEVGPLCKISNISRLEIEEAIRIAREDNAGGSDDEIIRAAARLFGFRRVGPDVQLRLQASLSAT